MHGFNKTPRQLFLAAALLAATAPAFAATNHTVTVGGAAGLKFTPQTLNIAAGDTVTFTNGGGLHNVASDPGAVTTIHCSDACGPSPTGNPSSNAWSQTITFSTPGTVGVFCEQHGGPGSGMFGTINVTVPVDLQSFDVN